MAIRMKYGSTPGVNLAAGFLTQRDALDARRSAAAASAGGSAASAQFGALSRERGQKRALAHSAEQAYFDREHQAGAQLSRQQHESQQSEQNQDFQAEQAQLNRDQQLELAGGGGAQTMKYPTLMQQGGIVGSGPQQPVMQPTGDYATPRSLEDLQQLSPGSIFRAPDGSLRRYQ